jgi:hypothetical protein
MIRQQQQNRHAITVQSIHVMIFVSMMVLVHTFPITTTTKHHSSNRVINMVSTIPTTTTAISVSTTRLFSTSIPNENSANKMESYGEQSRIYRRDVFNYDNWVEHRSTNRFVGNLFDVLKSGVFRQLLPNCLYMSSIALFIVLYNTVFVQGYDDFSGVHHDAILSSFMVSLPLLKIPGDFFSLCTPSLALLLGTSWCRVPWWSVDKPVFYLLSSFNTQLTIFCMDYIKHSI